jgi:hypothetical protein
VYGKTGEYMKFLSSTWKKEREAEKKAGIITGYEVLLQQPADADDADGFFACREELRGFQGSGSEQANAGKKDQENAHETGKATTRLHG